MRADMANKIAEVENVTTGEMYTSGGGDSDFSTAEVTLIADSLTPDGGGFIEACAIIEDNIYTGSTNLGFDDSSESIITIVLYKGHSYGGIGALGLSVSGNVELSDIETEGDYTSAHYDITGDCTIHYISGGFA